MKEPQDFETGELTCKLTAPSRRFWLAMIAVFLIGLSARQFAFDHTECIRFELNQQNAFYWGDRIVRGAHNEPGAASWAALWHSYVNIFVDNEAHPPPKINTLDYVPLRLLMAGVWVNYLNIAYGPVLQWKPEFARSFATFSLVMELAAATMMFALAARWWKPNVLSPRSKGGDLLPAPWGRWQSAGAAAALLWLNPASIVDSHVWPHGQTWILPFYLAAVLAMVNRRYFVAGALIGLGTMFKGQMMLIAPMLILWPLFDRRWLGALRVAVGMACGIGLVASPWLLQGNFAWARAGFVSQGIYSDVLRKGISLNLPAVLDRFGHMTLHQHLVDLQVMGVHVSLELRVLLLSIYIALLACSTWGIARQAQLGSNRLLVSIAAPWALMFFILGQMDERYLVWAACFSAGAILVNRWSLVSHAMLSFAGAATMLEFLLINTPATAQAPITHLLVALNPLTWLLTAFAVTTLFLISMRNPERTHSTEQSPDSSPVRKAAAGFQVVHSNSPSPHESIQSAELSG